MRHYEEGASARIKADRSPVTDADEEAEKLILAELAAGISRRAGGGGRRRPRRAASWMSAQHFFLVDPVDGTKEFIRRSGEFTVNIGESTGRRSGRGRGVRPAIGRLFVGAAGAKARSRLSGGMLRAIAARNPRPMARWR